VAQLKREEMKKSILHFITLAGIISAALSASADRIQIGGHSSTRTAGWLDLAGTSGTTNVQPISFTDTNGITFTVTAESNVRTVYVRNIALTVSGGSRSDRIDGNEALKLSLAITGGTVSNLSASFLVSGLGSGEGFDVSDGTTSVVVANVGDNYQINYGGGEDLDGLTPLSEHNLDTWSIEYSVFAGMPATKAQFTAIILNYQVASVDSGGGGDSGGPYNIADETYTNTILWQTTNALYNSSTFLNEDAGNHWILSSYKGNSYIVYVDNDYRPRIVKVDPFGTSEEYFLDAPDYFVLEEDTHQYFSIGVDELGYIHVVGDMHNYSRQNYGHMPARYQSGNCMYWRSDNPEDISSFTWLGDTEGSYPPGTSFTYPRFVNDRHGRLFLGIAVRSDTDTHYRAANVSRFETTSMEWKLLGGTNELNNQCLLWEDNGLDGGTYSKCGPNNIYFDQDNRMHLATGLLNSDAPNPPGINFSYLSDIVYATSPDGGDTFEGFDGSLKVGPLRIDATNSLEQVDLVMTNRVFIPQVTEAFTDYEGNLYATFQEQVTSSIRETGLIRYNSASNQWDEIDDFGTLGDVVSDNLGVVTFVESSSPIIRRFWYLDKQIDVNTGYNSLTIDRRYIMDTGNIRAIPQRGSAGETFKLIDIDISRPGGYAYTNMNLAPTLHGKPISKASHSPDLLYSESLADDATDPEGDTLTFTKLDGPTWLTVSSNGTLSGIPGNLEAGLNRWKIQVDDGHGGIDTTTLEIVVAETDYSVWIVVSNGLDGADAVYDADSDGDGMDNLTEYALGGNPNVDDAVSIQPFYELYSVNGNNWLNYIYYRRLDALSRNLTYEVLATSDLTSNVWTNDIEEVGTFPVDSEFEAVFNRISTDTESQQFMKLEIGITE
jgi:hypothetical protein